MSDVFFDYPVSGDRHQDQELIFLPHWDQGRWSKFLAHTEVRRFKAGEMVIQPGERDRSFSIIIEGKLEVLIPRSDGTWRSTQVRDAGTVIGEQSFLDGKPRSAALRALEDGELVSISQDAFQTFSAREPELARDVLTELARTLSLKLRQANAFIAKWLK